MARELDLIVLRENTAGIFYAGKYRKEIGGELTACDECVYTWSQIERHARCAFDLAMGRKKHVTMVNTGCRPRPGTFLSPQPEY